MYLPIWRSERNVFIHYSSVLQGTYLPYNLVLREMFAYSTLWCYKVPIYLPTWRSERNVFIKYSLVHQGTYLPTNLAL